VLAPTGIHNAKGTFIKESSKSKVRKKEQEPGNPKNWRGKGHALKSKEHEGGGKLLHLKRRMGGTQILISAC